MKKEKIFIIIALAVVLVIIVLAALFSGKNNKQNPEINNQTSVNNLETIIKKEKKIKIVTTLFPMYDFAKQIGGDKVEVDLLLPPGVEAHSFEPKPTDIAKISEADIFIYTSEVMEPWVNNVLENISHKRLIIIKSTAVVNSETTEDDPHVWLDLTKAQKIVDSITGSLLDFDAPNAVLYLNNSKSYKEKLIALDDSYKRELLNCKNKEIILAGHSAFAYLAKRYNLDYLAAQGFSPDQEISSKQMIDLVKEIKEKKISSLYYEELIDPKMAQSLSRETGVKILELNAAHNIAKDDLKNGKTFLNIMSENLNNLKIGLECQL